MDVWRGSLLEMGNVLGSQVNLCCQESRTHQPPDGKAQDEKNKIRKQTYDALQNIQVITVP